MRIAALLLAAGESTRLGEPKQLLQDGDGTPLVSAVVHALRDAGCDPVVVVVGAHAEHVAHALIHDAATVFLVPNRAWAEGMGSSIRAGIASMSTHAMMADVDAVLIAACDMPTADGAHFEALRLAAIDGAERAGHPVRVASTYVQAATAQDGAPLTRGIPAVLPRHDWPALLALTGDRGAKPLFDDEATVTVPLSGGNFDLDTPEDVAAWRAATMREAPSRETTQP